MSLSARKKLPDVSELVPLTIEESSFRALKQLSWHSRTDFSQTDLSISEIHILSFIQVWTVGGINFGRFNRPIYCELVIPETFSDAVSEKLAKDLKVGTTPWEAFWTLLGQRFPDLFKMVKAVNLKKPRQYVHIPAEIAHCNGWFFKSLFNRQEHAKALFIAFTGVRNPRLCSHCITTFTNTITSAREHVMFPFFNCVSLPGYQSNDCANCLWSADAACSYRLFPGYMMLPQDRDDFNHPFTGNKSESTVPGEPFSFTLSPLNAPRISFKFPFPAKNANSNTIAQESAELAFIEDSFVAI